MERNDETHETIKALLRVNEFLDKIRRRVLLDAARDKLAGLFGYRSWQEWQQAIRKQSLGSYGLINDTIFAASKIRLQDPSLESEPWRAVGEDLGALSLIVYGSTTRDNRNTQAHDISEYSIAEMMKCVTALKSEGEKEEMLKVYHIVYG